MNLSNKLWYDVWKWKTFTQRHRSPLYHQEKCKLRLYSAFILYYLAQISSSSLRLGCCTHSTVSSAWNRVLVDAHRLSSSSSGSTSISIANERPFTHGATAHCSFILMNQDTNTLSLKMRQKPTQWSILNHPFLPPALDKLGSHKHWSTA